MKKILIIRFSSLRNEAHYQYLSSFKESSEEHEMTGYYPPENWARFNALLVKEKTVIDYARSSDITQQLLEADKREDRDLVGIYAIIRSGLHHFNPEVAEAARVLNTRYSDFGRIASKPYEEEVAAVSVLLDELNGQYAEQVATLNLQDWVLELTEAHSEFQRLFMLRNAQLAARPEDKFKTVSKEIEAEYKSIKDHFEAVLTINSTPELESFVRLLNTQIEYFNSHAHHTVKHDLIDASFDSVPTQPYADGKPVTPLPVVHYNGEELAFARDYNLAYRNNIDRGTATIIIKGKSKYTGTREITFNIE